MRILYVVANAPPLHSGRARQALMLAESANLLMSSDSSEAAVIGFIFVTLDKSALNEREASFMNPGHMLPSISSAVLPGVIFVLSSSRRSSVSMLFHAE